MTERVRGIAVVGMDCQNRAARRYEKCSYLWHYFRRFEPFRPSVPPTADAPRESLSGAPLPPPLVRLPLTPAQIFFSTFPYRGRFAKRTSVLTSSPRLVVARLRTPFPPLHVLFRHPHPIAPLRSEGGPHHTTGAHSGARSPPLPRAPL